MMRLLRIGAAVLLALSPLVASEPEVRCAGEGPAACPDLSPDPQGALDWSVQRVTFPRAPDDCAVEEGLVEEGARTLVRFSTVTRNLGPGDLVLGDPLDHPEWYAWSPCHGHHHFGDFAHYRVWTLEGHAAWTALRAARPEAPASVLLAESPDVAAQMRAGHKQGYCIADTRPMHPLAPHPKHHTCSTQGLTAMWADVYGKPLDGQWVDVTGLAPGRYVLEVELNPERLIEEASYADNAASLVILIPPA